MERIIVFDTTLRDGEQSPGATMTPEEKIRMAHELDALGVDVIEAGFPAASPYDAGAVARIAAEVRRPVVAGLARCAPADIEAVAAALEGAERPRIHVFLATSDIHLDHKLRIGREEALERIERSVSQARSYAADVEFSPEDATRTDLAFLCRAVRAAIGAGATTINIPDTVGYALPRDIARIMGRLVEEVDGIDDVVLSVHCHDDLGLAVANSLAGIEAGARQVECTVNGIGERAGNAALEEIVMALRVRRDFGDCDTGVVSERIHPASVLLTHLTGIRPQPNKAVVGENAFAHEAGIHQDGMLKNAMTYEIMTPATVGAKESRFVLGKHSGRRALRERYAEMGFDLDPEQLDRAYRLFVMLADRKKTILDEDLLAIYYEGTMEDVAQTFRLEDLEVVCGRSPSRARVAIRREDEEPVEATAEGDGPLAASFAAIDSLVEWETSLEDLAIHAATPGRDAVGEVHVQVRIDGRAFTGRAASTDVVDGGVRAYLRALDKAEHTIGLESRVYASIDLWGV